MQKLQVLIADDHETVRRGLKMFLKTFTDIEVVGEAINGLEVIRQCQFKQPDLILMDVAMPQMDGVATTRFVQRNYPTISIIGLIGFQSQQQAEQMLAAGALICLAKTTSPVELIQAILYASDSFTSSPGKYHVSAI
jgi:DNA-binding NarL/FixJ family response regulator